MWVFMNDSFLSVVEDRDNPVQLLVRSRVAGDIERAVCGLFPVEVFQDLKADYRYRAKMSRVDFERVMVESVRRIDYANFKDSIQNKERHEVALCVWREVSSRLGSFGRPGTLMIDEVIH